MFDPLWIVVIAQLVVAAFYVILMIQSRKLEKEVYSLRWKVQNQQEKHTAKLSDVKPLAKRNGHGQIGYSVTITEAEFINYQGDLSELLNTALTKCLNRVNIELTNLVLLQHEGKLVTFDDPVTTCKSNEEDNSETIEVSRRYTIQDF